MKSPLFRGRQNSQQRSAVLVIVLAFIVFLSLIIVSLTIALQTESQSAHYYAARNSADLMAQQGIEYVRAALTTAEQSTNAWATAPGHIYYWATNSTIAAAVNLDLSSGPTNSAATGIYAPPDLNRLVLSDDSLTAITGASTSAPMNVGWIYVHQNGLQEISQTPAINSANPIIGRFAYWTDDESSRIDLNTAYMAAGNTNSANHPSRIDLVSLLGNNYAQEVYTNALVSAFNSPDDARRLDANLAPIISANRFSLTHYAYNQNLNPWGLPKIILTTKQSVAGSNNGVANTNFLNILYHQTDDPGQGDNISTGVNSAAMATNINLINYYLTNAWPGYGGASFATKYGNVRTLQLALDIIEYVRNVESPDAVVIPERGTFTASPLGFDVTSTLTGNETTNVIFGMTRHPLITEMAYWQEQSETATNSMGTNVFRTYVQAEIYLPPNYGLSSYQVGGKDHFTVQNSSGTPVNNVLINTNGFVVPGQFLGTYAWVESGTDPMTPGSYCVVCSEYGTGNNNTGSRQTSRVGVYDGVYGSIYDIAPGWLSGPLITNTVASSDPILTAAAGIAEVNDPRVNKHPSDWIQEFDTIGNQPKPWTTAVTAIPPQDTGPSGVSQASLYMPPPKGSAFTAPSGDAAGMISDNTSGVVKSVAELGTITTGVECSNPNSGVPWRTIRLQPTPLASRSLPPDWVLLDLFQAPYSSTNRPTLYQPQITNGSGLVSMAGLVNINSSLTPFTNNPSITRSAPLLALLQNASTNVGAGATTLTPATAASAIGAMSMAANGTNYGVPAFTSPGELAEIQGIADGGEASELNLRSLVDLATTHGSTFRVFSIGQTLKQTHSGALVLQSEQYKEAIICQDSLTHHQAVLWRNISQ
jgi:Tfp pilus assembly protein PilX